MVRQVLQQWWAGIVASGKRLAYRLVALQLAASLMMALALLAISPVHALSGLAGGLIAALANVYFAARIFVPYKAQHTERLVGRFYSAELVKILLTGLLFVGVFLWIEPLSAGALFGSYLVVQMAPVLAAGFLE